MSSVGRTVLFVSHNPTALRNLCSTGLLLRDGAVVKRGPIGDVLSEYLGSTPNASAEIRPHRTGRAELAAALTRVFVVPVGGALGEPIRGTAPFTIGMEVEVYQAGEIGVFLHCCNDKQQVIFSTGSFFEDSLNGLRLDAGVHSFECVIPGHILTVGWYVLDVMLLKNRQTITTDAAVMGFQIADDFPRVDGWHYGPFGIIRPKTTWRCVRSGMIKVRSELAIDR
jgi:lipopolysaccharide transport system ATP-binding protein